MSLNTLERLIHEGADPESFKELALLYLKLLGYSHAQITDGSDDLGSDLSVWELGRNPEPVAVQMSVQKKGWKKKAETDALQVKKRLGLANFTYLTSQRVSNQVDQTLSAQLWSEHEITARFFGSMAIASVIHSERRTGDALALLGINARESAYGDNQQKPPLQEDLAYAYAFFGTDVENFRKDVIERSIAAYVTRGTTAPRRDTVEADVSSALGLDVSRANLVSSRIDHMLQRGDLRLVDGALATSEPLVKENRAVRILRSRQWRSLQDEISTLLGNHGLKGSKLERLTLEISDAAGALLLSSALSAKASINPGESANPVRKQIEIKLRRIEHRLTAVEIERDVAVQLIKELTTCISASEIGQTLLAGYLFISLLEMSETNLLQALGGKTGLEVFLDASVAIPILASLLYESHEDSFFERSLRSYEQSQRYGVALKLPRDYLEEAASHLIDASSLYQPLRDSNEDLRHSKNAFVAHFSTLSQEAGFSKDFGQYAASFGLTGPVPDGDFIAARNRVMAKMESLFSRYGIEVHDFGPVRKQAVEAAEADVSFIARDLNITRPMKLLEHDTRTVAGLTEKATKSGSALIFCTWDRLHLNLAAQSSDPMAWQAMDPLMLSDLLALASTEPDQTVGAAVEIAMVLDQGEAELGSEIWDELVRLEKTKLYDADLLAQAQEFKREYLTNATRATTREPLAAAWSQWKAAAPSHRPSASDGRTAQLRSD